MKHTLTGGVAAALAARRNVTVRNLPYSELRERLLDQEQVLYLPVLAAPSPEPKGAKGKVPITIEISRKP